MAAPRRPRVNENKRSSLGRINDQYRKESFFPIDLDSRQAATAARLNNRENKLSRTDKLADSDLDQT